MVYQCDICGRVLNENMNDYNIVDEEGSSLILCSLHAECGKVVASNNKINTSTMRLATLHLNRIRPDIKTEQEWWADWNPLDILIKKYNECLSGNIVPIPLEEKIDPVDPVEFKIAIQGDFVRQISEAKIIPKELLYFLSYCCNKPIIDSEPKIDLIYDEYSNPEKRTVQYGEFEYGIYMDAFPIQSGVGVHGERATWCLSGLPDGIKISAESTLDMRGGNVNYYSLTVSGDNAKLPGIIDYIKENFAREIKKIINSG